jgi:nitroreductase
MNTLQAIATRYSCRDFDGRLPDEADLQKIAEAGVQAPSGMNRQQWRVVVITNAALLAEMEAEGLRVMQSMPDPSLYERILARGGKLFYGAPCLIALPIAEANPPGAEYFDAGILAENIALAATDLGLASCLCGFTAFCFAGAKGAEFMARLGFPEGYGIGLGVLIGYEKAAGLPHAPDLGKISFVR